MPAIPIKGAIVSIVELLDIFIALEMLRGEVMIQPVYIHSEAPSLFFLSQMLSIAGPCHFFVFSQLGGPNLSPKLESEE
jgi:hypothetical protein